MSACVCLCSWTVLPRTSNFMQIKSTLTPQSTVVSHRRSTHERAHHNTTSRSYTRSWSFGSIKYISLVGGDGGDSGAANYVRKRDAPPSG
eukprot:scaffold89955_cov47-Phaeocystis_antarctica.AAC.4